MTLRALFAKEVYIRLTEDNTFICTVQRGILRSKPTEVPVIGAPVYLDGPDSEPCTSNVLDPKVRSRLHFENETDFRDQE